VVLFYNTNIKGFNSQRVINGEANYGRQVLAVSSINQKEVGCTEHTTVSLLYMDVTGSIFFEISIIYLINLSPLGAGKRQ
jgi:hypothetical protein